MASSAMPMPPPPDVRPEAAAPAQRPMMADQVGKLRQIDTRGMAQQGVEELDKEVSTLAESVMKIAQMAKTQLPALMGDIAKMAEIGVSIQSQVREAKAKQQQQPGATQPGNPTAQSPTDAQAAA